MAVYRQTTSFNDFSIEAVYNIRYNIGTYFHYLILFPCTDSTLLIKVFFLLCIDSFFERLSVVVRVRKVCSIQCTMITCAQRAHFHEAGCLPLSVHSCLCTKGIDCHHIGEQQPPLCHPWPEDGKMYDNIWLDHQQKKVKIAGAKPINVRYNVIHWVPFPQSRMPASIEKSLKLVVWSIEQLYDSSRLCHSQSSSVTVHADPWKMGSIAGGFQA